MDLISNISHVFQNHPNLILIWDFKSRTIVYQNRYLKHDLAYSDILEDKVSDLFSLIDIVVDSDRQEFENLFYQENGSSNLKTYISFENAFGRAELYQASVYDIDSRYRVCELSKLSVISSGIHSNKGLREEDYQSIMAIQTDGMAILDEFENVKYANKVASVLFGCYPESLVGRNIKDFLSKEDLMFIQQETSKRKKGESSIYELRIVRPDSKPCFILVTATPKFDKFGNFIETIGFFRDITDKKKAEEALRIEQEKIKNVLHSLQDLIFVFNEKGVFVDYLQSDDSRLYKNPSEFVGKHVNDVLPKHIADLQMKAIRDVKKTNKVKMYDYLMLVDKKERWFSAQISRLSGSVFYDDLYIGVVRDITARKQQEEKLKQNAIELQEVVEEKNKLISIVAHDLKNPFAAMLGMSEMLSKYYDNFSEEKRKEYLAKILINTKNIQSLLENTLQWSLNEQKRLSFYPTKIDIGQIVREVLRAIDVMLVQKEIEVLNNVPENLFVQADEQMMRNVFVNLITNAYKFSNIKGVIEINFYNNSDFYEFSVVDFGIGISQQMLKKLFVKDQATTREGTSGEKGTGLGLVLCKEFVKRHGGDIWAESIPQEKTSFFFTIKK